MRNMYKLMLTILLIATSSYGFCDGGYVHVDDMSKLDYQLVSSGQVYFRNLNEFKRIGGTEPVTGCCYAFYLDTTTEFGKSAWSTILMKMASGGDLYMYVTETNPPTSGSPAKIDHLGNW
mgnify:CR=1 FL=1